MGGKSSDKSSRQMVDQQKAEAADARAKEVARQERINQGLERIRQAFHGQPVMRDVTRYGQAAGPAADTVEGSQASGLPAGYTYARGPAKTVRQPTYANTAGGGAFYAGGGSSHGGGGVMSTTPTGSRVVTQQGDWMVKGPDGQLHPIGSNVAYTGQEDTGTTTGGPEDFYNKYQDNYLNYYLPQVAQKFGQAKDETTYALARAGTLRSSAATDELAKLIDQNKLNEADVRTKATNAVGDLKTRMASEEAKAQAQLYSTEDPNVAATSATNAVQNITAEEPSTTPLGDIFKVAAIGGANFLKGGTNRYYTDKYVPGNQPSTHFVTS